MGAVAEVDLQVVDQGNILAAFQSLVVAVPFAVVALEKDVELAVAAVAFVVVVGIVVVAFVVVVAAEKTVAAVTAEIAGLKLRNAETVVANVILP